MATNTWVALDTVTVANTSTTTIEFTNIPSTYEHLVVVANLRSSDPRSGFQSVSYTFNNTNTGYGATILQGNGSNAVSYNQNNAPVFEGICYMDSGNSGQFVTNTLNIMNYASTSAWKPCLLEFGNGGLGIYKSSGTWRNNSAITSIQIKEPSNLSWAIGSNASIYGLSAAGAVASSAKATGGTITYDQYGNVIHTFTSNGTFTPTEPLSDVEYLVVAGGGAGGVDFSGGGGAGGYLSSINSSRIDMVDSAYAITIGGGGTGGTRGNGANGGSGTASSIIKNGTLNITAAGGGGGGSLNGTMNGLTGGSGGGGSGGYGGTTNIGNGGVGNTPATSPSQGFSGGYGYSPADYGSNRYGGGGGGAGAIGTNATSGARGTGGTGVINTIGGTTTRFSTGGNGCNGQSYTGSSASANTGNGGEGSGENITGGNGGSGIVIIRYAG